MPLWRRRSNDQNKAQICLYKSLVFGWADNKEPIGSLLNSHRCLFWVLFHKRYPSLDNLRTTKHFLEHIPDENQSFRFDQIVVCASVFAVRTSPQTLFLIQRRKWWPHQLQHPHNFQDPHLPWWRWSGHTLQSCSPSLYLLGDLQQCTECGKTLSICIICPPVCRSELTRHVGRQWTHSDTETHAVKIIQELPSNSAQRGDAESKRKINVPSKIATTQRCCRLNQHQKSNRSLEQASWLVSMRSQQGLYRLNSRSSSVAPLPKEKYSIDANVTVTKLASAKGFAFIFIVKVWEKVWIQRTSTVFRSFQIPEYSKPIATGSKPFSTTVHLCLQYHHCRCPQL